MKLYTKSGDDGTTALFGGGRVPKHCTRVRAYGEVDELNAVLGWCRSVAPAELGAMLQDVQNALFAIGAELANAENIGPTAGVHIDGGDVQRLEQWIDRASAAAPPLKHFILPGGDEVGARLHVARSVCRRTERSLVSLLHEETVRSAVLQYLNRLGDALFALARQVNHASHQPEIKWSAQKAHS